MGKTTARSDGATRHRSGRSNGPFAGFAYLWLLFLVAFMGVGMVVGSEVSSVAVQRDKERELLAIGHQFRAAIRSYRERTIVAGQRQYPPSLEALLLDNRGAGVTRHLRKIFVDPMTGKAEWGLLKVGNGIAGVYSLSEAAPIKRANFEVEDIAFHDLARYRDWIFTHPSNLAIKVNGERQAAEASPGASQIQLSEGSMQGALGAQGLPGAPAAQGNVTLPVRPSSPLPGMPSLFDKPSGGNRP